MATRKTNAAVQKYRDVIKANRRAEQLDAELNGMVEGMTEDEFQDYVKMTLDIDAQMNAVGESSETVLRAAANEAGRDA